MSTESLGTSSMKRLIAVSPWSASLPLREGWRSISSRRSSRRSTLSTVLGSNSSVLMMSMRGPPLPSRAGTASIEGSSPCSPSP